MNHAAPAAIAAQTGSALPSSSSAASGPLQPRREQSTRADAHEHAAHDAGQQEDAQQHGRPHADPTRDRARPARSRSA
jgi:hypothetical protein